MSRRLVNEGEEVYQGQQLGLLGNTGLSSGAHLDFQVMLGTEVLDPATFLTIKNEFIRWFGNR
jgi:murein DD-endopeptidase MepM/ murein hydrolase activator NlpD